MEKRTVFIIDDEEIIRKTLSIHLTKGNYSVIQSAGGSGIFEELKNNNYELVISDIRMPEVNGLQILEYVKKNYADIPVLILTGLMDLNITIEAMKMGAFDFLIKPITKEHLLNTVQNALHSRDLLIQNKKLEKENLEYRTILENKVEERTEQLNKKTVELENAYETLQKMNFQMVKVLAEAIEAKDKYTRGHCDRMRLICLKIGELLGISEEEKTDLEFAAVLHDLGKIGIADSILNKIDTLSENEFDMIKEHSLIGEKIISEISTFKNVSMIIKHHHENYDGSGYPGGLKGSHIPLLSRIIAVADVFDALTSNRPYRESLSIESAISEIKNISGTKLDPSIVQLLISNREYFYKNSYTKLKPNQPQKYSGTEEKNKLLKKSLCLHAYGNSL